MNTNKQPSEHQTAPPFIPPQNVYQAKCNLKYYRAACGLSQHALARKLQVRQPTVNRWESTANDRFIPMDKLEQVAAALFTEASNLAYEAAYIPSDQLEPRTALDFQTGETVSLNLNPSKITDYKNNLRYYRVKKRLSQRAFSKLVGMSPSMAYIWENPQSPSLPTQATAPLIARILDADLSLIIPRDEAGSAIEISENVTSSAPQASDLDRVYDDRSNVSTFTNLDAADTVLNMKTNAVGFAGDGYSTELQFDSSLAELMGIPLKSGLAAAKVVGQSMYNPTTGAGIPDGAVVIIDTSKRDVKSCLGKIVCYMTNGYYMLKRLQSNRGVLNAASDNPSYFPIFYTNDQDVQLIGEVICILSRPC